MRVDVGEELGHRIGAHIIDPGLRHRQMQIDGRDHQGGLAGGVGEIEHAEWSVAEAAAIVKEISHVFGVFDAAQDHKIHTAFLHHLTQSGFVEQQRLPGHN